MASKVILGLWPMAGITSEIVDQATNLATIRAGIEAGIDTIDTAYSYGYDGESDRLLGQILAADAPRPLRVIGKVGQRWTPERQRVVDGSPKQLIADAEESLRRMGIQAFDLLMLHSVDPDVDIRRSAEALVGLRDRGLAQAIGVCNASLDELNLFSQVVVPAAVQLPLNILQRDILETLVPWCREHGVAVHVYWVLMKGILAGRIAPDHRFPPGDSRPKYAIYQGETRQRTHRLVETLERIGRASGQSVAQLSVGWALSQPGITAALVGAKRPEQIQETAVSEPLSSEIVREIDQAAEGLDL